MRAPAAGSRVEWIAATAVLVALVAGAFAVRGYVSEERRWADMIAVDSAVGLLSSVPTTDTGGAARQGHALAMHNVEYEVGLFLHSDSRSRTGGLANHIERCWKAHLAAEHLWTLFEEGEVRPLVDDVYGGSGMLEEFPRLSALSVGEGSSRRYLNDDLAVVRVLLEEGLLEIESAMRSWRRSLHEPGMVL